VRIEIDGTIVLEPETTAENDRPNGGQGHILRLAGQASLCSKAESERMTDREDVNLYTGFTIGSVHRLLGEGLIAVGFRYNTGKQHGYALTNQEATALLVALLVALQTDDPVPQANPSIRLQRNISAMPHLAVEEFGLLLRDGEAHLSVRLANGLELPLVFPASDLLTLRQLVEKAEKKPPG